MNDDEVCSLHHKQVSLTPCTHRRSFQYLVFLTPWAMCPCALFKSCSADRIIKLLTTSSTALITAIWTLHRYHSIPICSTSWIWPVFYQWQAKVQKAQRWKRLLSWLCFHSAIDCMSKALIPAGREHTIFLQVINNTGVKFKALDTRKGISSWDTSYLDYLRKGSNIL